MPDESGTNHSQYNGCQKDSEVRSTLIQGSEEPNHNQATADDHCGPNQKYDASNSKLDWVAGPARLFCEQAGRFSSWVKRHTNSQRIAAIAAMAAAITTIAYTVFAKMQWQAMEDQLTEMRAARQDGATSGAEQMAVMRGQLEQMQNSQRPWVEITSVDIIKLEIARDWVFVWADIGVKNVGHSPATDLHINPVLLPEISMTDEGSQVRAACDKAKSSDYCFYQTVLFPGEERTIHPNESLLTTPIASLLAEEKARAWNDYIQSRPLIGNKRALERADYTLSLPLRNGLSLIGCVAYKIQGSEVAHATSFGRSLTRECQPSPTGMCAFDFSIPTIIDRNIIGVRDFLSASYAD